MEDFYRERGGAREIFKKGLFLDQDLLWEGGTAKVFIMQTASPFYGLGWGALSKGPT